MYRHIVQGQAGKEEPVSIEWTIKVSLCGNLRLIAKKGQNSQEIARITTEGLIHVNERMESCKVDFLFEESDRKVYPFEEKEK